MLSSLSVPQLFVSSLLLTSSAFGFGLGIGKKNLSPDELLKNAKETFKTWKPSDRSSKDNIAPCPFVNSLVNHGILTYILYVISYILSIFFYFCSFE